jgi:hypothetical protein
MEEEIQRKYILLKKVELPFSDYVEVSKKARGKPYVKDKCRVPLKYQTDDYFWNAKGYLARTSDGLVLTSNPKIAGKPRIKKINGQDIYNGAMSKQARAFIKRVASDKLTPYLRDIEPLLNVENYPLGIAMNFHIHDNGKRNLDNDNRWIWEKALQDTLVTLKIIPDDNPYIIWENIKRSILISNEKEESLVIEIYGYA